MFVRLFKSRGRSCPFVHLTHWNLIFFQHSLKPFQREVGAISEQFSMFCFRVVGHQLDERLNYLMNGHRKRPKNSSIDWLDKRHDEGQQWMSVKLRSLIIWLTLSRRCLCRKAAISREARRAIVYFYPLSLVPPLLYSFILPFSFFLSVCLSVFVSFYFSI